MTQVHQCNRDDCPTENVNGPKINCAKCKKVCFMKCFGVEKRENLENVEIVKIPLKNGGSMLAFLPYTAFVCCADTLSNTEVKKIVKMPSVNRSTSKTRATKSTEKKSETENASILEEIKSMVTEIKMQTSQIHTATDFLVTKSTRPDLQRSAMPSVTPKSKQTNAFATKTPITSFSQAVKSNLQSAKRKREQSPKPQPKPMKFPSPKICTGTKVSSLIVVPKKVREMKPTFDRALCLSGLDPMTPVEEIVNHICDNTPVTDKSKFKVYKLVKKDRDLSTLSFVSFKIEVNQPEFDELFDPSLWPTGSSIRKFLVNQTMGDFFPELPTKASTSASMDITEENTQQTPSKNASIRTPSSRKSSPDKP